VGAGAEELQSTGQTAVVITTAARGQVYTCRCLAPTPLKSPPRCPNIHQFLKVEEGHERMNGNRQY